MRAQKRLLALGLLLTAPLGVLRADTSVGAAYLLRGVSPQEDALGGGALTTYGNAAAQWENPAALAGAGPANLTLSQEFAPLNGDAEYLAASLGLGPDSQQHLGLQAYYRGDDDTYRNDLGQIGATFTNLDALAGLSYAFQNGPLGLGLGIKALTASLAGQTAQPGVLGDLGLLYVPGKNLMLSAALRNLGSVPFWTGGTPYRPESLDFAARENPNDPWQAHFYQFFNLDYPNDQSLGSSLEILGSAPQVNYGFGMDYDFSGRIPLVLRAGYTNGTENLDFPYGVSVGFGLTWSGIEFDYTFSDLGELGASNRLGLTWAPRLPAWDKTKSDSDDSDGSATDTP